MKAIPVSYITDTKSDVIQSEKFSSTYICRMVNIDLIINAEY